MNKYGHPGLQASPSGSVVHLEKGWLGASPDAWVTDPSFTLSKGIAEFKCPYTKLGVSPEEACEDICFCCALVYWKVQLKKYIHCDQVQLQLYVALDLCRWCDLCLYYKRCCTGTYFPQHFLAEKELSYFIDCMLP